MFRKNSRCCVAALTLALAAAFASPGAAQQRSLTPPNLAPPTPIYPINGLDAAVPIVFRWTNTALAGNNYGVTLKGVQRGTLVVAAPPTAYELQISDQRDVSNHILFDVIAGGTTYVFTNQNLPGSGFTNAQPPGIPLSGGHYYWHVRALTTGPAAPYSYPPADFRLIQNAASSMPLHDLAVTDLSVASRPRAHTSTIVFATVANVGTFPEGSTTLSINANGVTIAEGSIPPLAPNERVRVAAAWTPPLAGAGSIQALLILESDMNPDNNHALLNVVIEREATAVTSLSGTLRLLDGIYELRNDKNGTIAVVVPKTGIDLGSFVGKRISVKGILTSGTLGLSMRPNLIGSASPTPAER